MLKKSRQERILEILESNRSVSVTELGEVLNVSLMTIRRDLDDMDQQKLLKKVYGGAVPARENDLQPSFYERIGENIEEKTRLAQAAVGLFRSGDIVFFDAGTTVLCAAYAIPETMTLTVITNSLITATELCKKTNVNVIMLGGELHHSSFSAVNGLALNQIQSFNADIALFSTKAFSYPEGMYEALLSMIELKKAFAQNARKRVLLLDHTKFETKSLSLSIPFKDIDTIITSQKAPAEIVRKMTGAGKEVFVV